MATELKAVQLLALVLETITHRAEISLWMNEDGDVCATVGGGPERFLGYGDEKPKEPGPFSPGDEFHVKNEVDIWTLVRVPTKNRIFFVDTSYNSACFDFEVGNPLKVTQEELDKHFGKGFLIPFREVIRDELGVDDEQAH